MHRVKSKGKGDYSIIFHGSVEIGGQGRKFHRVGEEISAVKCAERESGDGRDRKRSRRSPPRTSSPWVKGAFIFMLRKGVRKSIGLTGKRAGLKEKGGDN